MIVNGYLIRVIIEDLPVNISLDNATLLINILQQDLLQILKQLSVNFL